MLMSTCRNCGKSIIKLGLSQGPETSPDRRSWMTNDSDGNTICHAPPWGMPMPREPQNDAHSNVPDEHHQSHRSAAAGR
jgi:hypothetical protein